MSERPSDSLRLRRESLPLFKVLPRPALDIARLQNEIKLLGYDDYSKYTDLDFGGEYVHLCNQYNETHTKFLDTEEAKRSVGHYNGRLYRQLALTSFDAEKFPGVTLVDPILDRRIAIRRATDVNAPDYLPQLDERNYCVPNQHAKGALLEILKSFKARFTRSRLAVLMPGFEGKPHIDYNTDYSIRIHIPIFTNEQSHFCYVKKDGSVEALHMPADGRMWFVNNGYTHYVTNLGTTPRLHIVVNLETQEDLYET